jgi:catechol 2,3-dioxygenase-like lactoylglutathione lyase family enzyme
MIGYVMFGTNNVKESTAFYDSFFDKLGIIKVEIEKEYVGYAMKKLPEDIIFYITKPYNNEKASFGNGTMLAFQASSNNVVDDCHSIALTKGAINEGTPGLREGYGSTYYTYFCDLDNNKVCIYSRG